MSANLSKQLKLLTRFKYSFLTLGLCVGLSACSNEAEIEASVAPVTVVPTVDSVQINRLAESVQRAEDLSDIKKLQKAYGYYLDKGMWTDLAEFFTQDAVANYPAGIFVGYDSIKEHLYRNVGGVEMGEVGLGDNRLYNHMNIQPVVHLDASGNTGRGRWRAMAMFGRFGSEAGIWAEGVYNMRYAKEDGVWKISDLQYNSGFGDSYAYGWGASPDAESGSATRTLAHAPDQARSMACDGYPSACIAEFYFDNPGNTVDANAWTLPEDIPASGAGNQQASVSDLLHRAQLLKDELDVENLQRIYGFYLDRKMWDELAELFVEDGSIEMAQRGVYVGKTRVREFLNLLGDEGLAHGELNDHVQLQTIVDVAADGATAKARSREWNMIGVNQVSGEWSAGLYENDYIKVDGEWKIQALHYYPTFITDYDLGWTVDAQPAPGVSATLPPDLPPSVVYEIYPKAHVPAYHYANPVTGNVSTYPELGGPSQASIDATMLAVMNFEPVLVNDIQAGLTEAERLVGRVKDHQEIENLENAYGYYLDKNLWNDLAELFAVEGSMELAQRGVYIGRERVREFLFNVFGNDGPVEGRLGNHLHMQPVIHVSDDGTTGLVRSRMMQQLNFGGRPSMGAAIYVNEVVKEEGAWRFKSTHALNTWTAGYAGGWKESPAQSRVPGPSENFPADTPPTVQFSMFPDIYDLPFHY
jgi:hypothetical protein